MQNSTLLHIIFTVKDDMDSFLSDFNKKLVEELEFFCLKEGSKLIEASCAADHMHLLLAIRHESSVSQVLNSIKHDLEVWLQNNCNSDFLWKRGYSAFSITSDKVAGVAALIGNQQELHDSISFKDELRIMMSEDFESINY